MQEEQEQSIVEAKVYKQTESDIQVLCIVGLHVPVARCSWERARGQRMEKASVRETDHVKIKDLCVLVDLLTSVRWRENIYPLISDDPDRDISETIHMAVD